MRNRYPRAHRPAQQAIDRLSNTLPPQIMQGNVDRALGVVIADDDGIQRLTGERDGCRVGALQRRLIDQAIMDPLTGAFNRRHMEGSLGDAIERQRRSSAPASLLLIDVDHFKRINDQLGHAKGDGVLKGIVSVVGKRSRKLDLLFRIGGEEFMLLLPDTQEAAAAILAEQLRASIAKSPLLDGRRVTVSVGVGELQPGESMDSWIKHTDDALYAAKNAGRNRVARAAEVPAQEQIQ